MREVLGSQGAHGLLLRATEGEPYANPEAPATYRTFHSGVSDILFEAEHDTACAASRTCPMNPMPR